MGGWMVVPQNPIRDAGTALVPSLQGLAAGRAVRIPHVGELMPGQFAVPQNPLRGALGRVGCGCAGGGCLGGCGGMGDTISDWFNSDSLTNSLAIPNWAILAAIGLGGIMLFGGKKRR